MNSESENPENKNNSAPKRPEDSSTMKKLTGRFAKALIVVGAVTVGGDMSTGKDQSECDSNKAEARQNSGSEEKFEVSKTEQEQLIVSLIEKEEWDSLVKIGPDAVKFLAELMDIKFDEKRKDVALALGEIGTPEAIEALVNAIRMGYANRDLDVCEYAEDGLAKIGKPVIPVLTELTKDKPGFVSKVLAEMAPGGWNPGNGTSFERQLEDLRDNNVARIRLAKSAKRVLENIDRSN